MFSPVTIFGKCIRLFIDIIYIGTKYKERCCCQLRVFRRRHSSKLRFRPTVPLGPWPYLWWTVGITDVNQSMSYLNSVPIKTRPPLFLNKVSRSDYWVNIFLGTISSNLSKRFASEHKRIAIARARCKLDTTTRTTRSQCRFSSCIVRACLGGTDSFHDAKPRSIGRTAETNKTSHKHKHSQIEYLY